MILRTVAAGLVAALVLGACGGDDDDDAADDGTPAVVASFFPLAEVARQVGGDLVAVQDLTPAAAEPHDLELTTDQVDDLEDADLAIVMGRDFQPAVEQVADRRDGPTVVVLDAIDAPEANGPHVWLDPTQMRAIVDVVASALADVDSANTATYEARAAAYNDELDALDQEFASGLESCARREIITAHEAFGWLADRYDLEQLAIAGLEPGQEPSADRIAELADLADGTGATTIFTETLVPSDVAETVAREAGGLRTRVLNPIEGLTDEERDAGEDYVSLMRANLAALREALDCR
jgi:zinc transport system substrate-binding protein